jgi:hypothetical protein
MVLLLPASQEARTFALQARAPEQSDAEEAAETLPESHEWPPPMPLPQVLALEQMVGC